MQRDTAYAVVRSPYPVGSIRFLTYHFVGSTAGSHWYVLAAGYICPRYFQVFSPKLVAVHTGLIRRRVSPLGRTTRTPALAVRISEISYDGLFCVLPFRVFCPIVCTTLLAYLIPLFALHMSFVYAIRYAMCLFRAVSPMVYTTFCVYPIP